MWTLLQVSFGTASLVALIYAVWPNISHRDIMYRRQAWIAMACFFVLTASVYYIGPEAGVNHSLIQSDTVQVSGRGDKSLSVFYPKPYKSAPYLKLQFAKGDGEINILEQRADGFILSLRDVSYVVGDGAHIEWSATGSGAE